MAASQFFWMRAMMSAIFWLDFFEVWTFSWGTAKTLLEQMFSK